MEIEQNQTYAYDWSIILVSVILAICSYYLDFIEWKFIFTETVYWFQRSGSLVVLLAVVLEFRQIVYTKEGDKVQSLKGVVSGNFASSMNDKQKLFQWFAIGLSIAGTFIWGYGDLRFKT